MYYQFRHEEPEAWKQLHNKQKVQLFIWILALRPMAFPLYNQLEPLLFQSANTQGLLNRNHRRLIFELIAAFGPNRLDQTRM